MSMPDEKDGINTGQDIEKELRLLEALLFAAAEPLSIGDMCDYFSESAAQNLPDYLKMLKHRYDGRGINLVERNGCWAFRTAQDLAPALTLEREVQKKLSRAATETLSIIAYHQPITRAEIESIRGVATSRGTLDILIEAGWVKPGRRKRVPGRPLTWVTTNQFLDHFGFESLDELPGVEELKAAGLLDKRPAIEAMPQTADMFDDEDEDRDDEIEDSAEDSYDDDNFDFDVLEDGDDIETQTAREDG